MSTMTSDCISIPSDEYEALTGLEAYVNKMCKKTRPLDKMVLDRLIEQIRFSRFG